VIQAKEVPAMANGHDYIEATRLTGIKSGDTVSRLVERYNQEGLQAIQLKHGRGSALLKF